MGSKYEITNFNHNGTVLKISLYKLKNSFKHCHESLEVLFILSGQASIFIDNNNYQLSEDDIFLINSNQIHEMQSLGCALIILQINSAFLQELVPDEAVNIRFNCNSSVQKDKSSFHNIKVIIAKLIKRNTEGGKFLEYMNKALLYEFFYELFSHFRFVDSELPPVSRKNLDRTTRIIRFINENYFSYISLESLAEKENLSAPYLSRYFKESIGQTFKSFLDRVRLFHAVNDLTSTDKTIMQIAADVGFSNTRSFTSTFRDEYGENPDQYRKKNNLRLDKQTPEIDYTNIEQSDYLKKLTNYLNDEINTTIPVKSNLKTISTGPINTKHSYRNLTHNFKNILSFGDSRSILYSEIQEMLKEVQKEIGFRYILIHGFFDKSIAEYLLSEDAEPVFNFSLLDKIIDFVISIQLKPFFKLGYEFNKTSIISQLLRESETITPVLNRWSALVEAFISHLERRYGSKQVTTWRFCLQEEYDRNKLTINTENENRYKQLYYTTFKVIKSLNNNIPFGPSPLMPYMMTDPPGISGFFDFFIEQKCMPDFLTFKFFPVIPEAEKKPKRFLLSPDPDAFKLFIDKICTQVKINNITSLPLYLTDWNSSTSNKDLLNDTCFKSTYMVKNILQNYDKINSFGYWILSDFNLDLPAEKELFHGGLGLFTKNGIKKPSYYALWLLGKLGNHLIAHGDGYFITANEGSYQIMAYNYCHYSSLYASGERFDMTFHDRYTPFEKSRIMELKIQLNKLSDGEYTLKKYFINRKAGSCFDQWIRTSTEEISDKEELEILKAHSAPGLEIKTVSILNEKFLIDLELDPHEIQMVLLTKQQK